MSKSKTALPTFKKLVSLMIPSRATIKGGVGSGNFGHEGIIGHQGGSQPGSAKDRGDLTPPKQNTPDLEITEAFKDHPLIREYLGDNPKDYAIPTAIRGADLKRQAVEGIAKGIHVSDADANEFVKSWAESSNDHSLSSLIMQKAAADELDVPFSLWQQSRYAFSADKAEQDFINAYQDHRIMNPDQDPATSVRHAMDLMVEHKTVVPFQMTSIEQSLAVGHSPINKHDALTLYHDSIHTAIDKNKKAVRYMYNTTQKFLDEAGITEIKAYRGMYFADGIEMPSHWSQGDSVVHTMNALSSWSLSDKVARKFTTTSGSVLFESAIPANRIISMPSTGIGCNHEWEVVIMGNKYMDTSVIKEIANDNRSWLDEPLFKGGPGSGNHGHEGIPGHQGGSKPGENKLVAPGEESPTFETTPKYRSHPVLSMYVGEQVKQPYFPIDMSSGRIMNMKRQALKRLAKGIDVDENHAEYFINSWAASSNDHALKHLVAQEAAAQEFDVPLSDWQINRLAQAHESASKSFDEMFVQHAAEGLDAKAAALKAVLNPDFRRQAGVFQVAHLEKSINSATEINGFDHVKALYAQSIEYNLGKSREAVRHMYNETQKLLEQQGVTEVRAYRGFRFEGQAAPDEFQVGHTVQHTQNALSSWSVTKRAADNVTGAPDDHGVTFESMIPARRIVSMPVTGIGNAKEWELVVMGDHALDESRVVTRPEYLKSVAVYYSHGNILGKGGPGSGNFGHRGIIGQRGGSAPSGGGSVGAAGVGIAGGATLGHGSVIGSSHPVGVATDKIRSFVSQSPELSRKSASTSPLPKSFLTTPTGYKPGEQHLAEVLKGTGVSNHLPTKKSLEIGEKSIFMPVRDQTELEAFMDKRLEEQGIRSAATPTSGLFHFDGAAGKGANAHAQIKPDAKKEDVHQLDKARLLARAQTHGLLLSAVQKAAQTGNWAEANALEIQYQMTGNIGTFGLLMGTQVVTLGTNNGALILDRAAIDVHPTPVVAYPQAHTTQSSPKKHKTPHKVAVVGKGKIIKGGAGSGNYGHAGRPGEQGGSAEGDDSVEEISGTKSRQGFREEWDEHKEYLAYTHSFMPPYRTDTQFRELIDKRVRNLDDLSQDELADLYKHIATKPSYSPIEYVYDSDLQTAIADDDHSTVMAILKGKEKTSYSDDRHSFALMASRLDEEYANSAFKSIMEQRSSLEKAASNSSVTAARSLVTYGPTAASRLSAEEQLTKAGIRGNGQKSNQGAGNLDEDIQQMVTAWTFDSRTENNPWVHAAVYKAMNGGDSITGYWNNDTYGIKFSDPSPHFVAAAKEIYGRTQAYYAKSKTKEVNLFRGIKSAVSTRSVLESWSQNEGIAKKFDGYDVMKISVDRSRVFMTWESMKGIFPPESELKGKKEFTVLGLDWMKP